MTDVDRKRKKHCSKMSTALQGLWLTEREIILARLGITLPTIYGCGELVAGLTAVVLVIVAR